jgi:hypothetical protein
MVLRGKSAIPDCENRLHALYLCSCTDVAQTGENRRDRVSVGDTTGNCLRPATHFVCVRIGASFRPLLSRALRSVPFEIASVMNLVANASASG